MANKKKARRKLLPCNRIVTPHERIDTVERTIQGMRGEWGKELTELRSNLNHVMSQCNGHVNVLRDFDRRLTQAQSTCDGNTAGLQGLRSDLNLVERTLADVVKYIGYPLDKQHPAVPRGATMEEIDAVIASYGGPGIETRTGNAIKAIAIELKARRLRDQTAQEGG